MIVCIAEKPSVAREIASVLGAKDRKDGYIEGNGYQVTWTFGHLCTLKEPHDYDPQQKSWRIYHLPIIPPKFDIKLIKAKGISQQFNTIKKLVKGCDEIVNCGDAGQEGELIQRWVLKLTGCDKPMKRLWISSLTEEAIRKGFQDLKPAEDYDRLYAAGGSRAIGDWLLGINATRLYTLKYGTGKNVLSIGRVQTPTLALIVNRDLEIRDFKSEPFWEVKTKYRDVVFSYTGGKQTEKEKGQGVVDKTTGQPFKIVTFQQKAGKEYAPKLFDLTALQVECNKKFGFSADQTLKTVQGLYERKFVTYPRVDTTYLPLDVYPQIPGIMKSMTRYSAFTETLLKEPIKKSKKVFDDKKVTDHHAIIPTSITAQGLGGADEKVYDLIARRFLAVFYPDCEVSKTEVIGESAAEKFKATGKQILSPGWRAVYEEEKEDKKDDEDSTQTLPNFVEGEEGPHEPYLEEKVTKPPKRYTEATLLRAMETAGKLVDQEELREALKENGIGRPATRANIIETLFRRKYIIKQRKSLLATETGIELIGTINNDLLKSAELTGQWEYKLRQIEKGEKKVGEFMTELRAMVSGIVTEVKNDRRATTISYQEKPKKTTRGSTKSSKEPLTCPKCKKGRVLTGKKAFGCSSYKEGCSFVIPFDFHGKKISEAVLRVILEKGKSKLIKGFSANGKKADGFITYSPGEGLKLEAKAEEKWVCPKCTQGMVLKGGSAYGCSRFKEGCDFRVPFVIKDKKLTESQVKALVLKGKTTVIKGFVKNGEKFDARLIIDQSGRVVWG